MCTHIYMHTLSYTQTEIFYCMITEDKMIMVDLESRESFGRCYSVFDEDTCNEEHYFSCEVE